LNFDQELPAKPSSVQQIIIRFSGNVFKIATVVTINKMESVWLSKKH